jgi:hypothetical protein
MPCLLKWKSCHWQFDILQKLLMVVPCIVNSPAKTASHHSRTKERLAGNLKCQGMIRRLAEKLLLADKGKTHLGCVWHKEKGQCAKENNIL